MRYSNSVLGYIFTLAMLFFPSSQCQAIEWTIENVHIAGCGWHPRTSLVLMSQGYPCLCYYDDSTWSLNYAYKNAQGWHFETVDSMSGWYVGLDNSIVLDTAGYPHISYRICSSQPGGCSRLKYAYKDASGWHSSIIDGGEGWAFTGISSSLKLDGSGNPHISYVDTTNTWSLRYAHKSSGEWLYETLDGAGQWRTSLFLDSSGYPHISYESGGVKYAYKDSSGWHFEIVEAGQYAGPSLALDHLDYPHIAYYDSGNKCLRYAFRDDSEWHYTTVDTNTGAFTSLKLDAMGYPHISYMDIANVYYVKYAWKDTSEWHLSSVDNQCSGGVEGDNITSLGLDTLNHVYISYYDCGGGHVKLAYGSQTGPTQSKGKAGIFLAPRVSGKVMTPAELHAFIQKCKDNKIGDVFLHAFESTNYMYGELQFEQLAGWQYWWGNSVCRYNDSVNNFIRDLKTSIPGIRVYALVACFIPKAEPPGKPNVVPPDDVNTINTHAYYLANDIIPYLIHNYPGIDGICLDLVRYENNAPSTTNITNFTNKVRQNIGNSKLLSACLICNPSVFDGDYDGNVSSYTTCMNSCKSYWGNDWSQISKYLNFMMPMTYAGKGGETNYDVNKIKNYVGGAIHHAVTATAGSSAKVYPCIQTYTDNSSADQETINASIEAALVNGAIGYAAFRYLTITDDNWWIPIKSYSNFTPGVRTGDYNGDGKDDIGIYRPITGMWSIRGITTTYFGGAEDLPINGDYNGDGITDISIFRPSSGLWSVKNITRVYFGNSSSIPVPRDYSGDGRVDIAVFSPSSGLWSIKDYSRCWFGGSNDIPVPGLYGGVVGANIGIFRPSSGLWSIKSITRCYLGSSRDTPVTADFNGDGKDDIGIFRASQGLWVVKGITRCFFGNSEDVDAPADLNGDGTDDIVTFRKGLSLQSFKSGTNAKDIYIYLPSKSNITTAIDKIDISNDSDCAPSSAGIWAARMITRCYFGSMDDLPVVSYHSGNSLPAPTTTPFIPVTTPTPILYVTTPTPFFPAPSWLALDSGMNDIVSALACDGSSLYAGGLFTTAGGSGANYIAKWNGSSWSALGSGMGGISYCQVEALTGYVSGYLYAAGVFYTAGGVDAKFIAKWNGSSWSALGSGTITGNPYALASDLSGNLYAGGLFDIIGGVTVNYIAKWNGSSWSALGSGMGGLSTNYVSSLACDGSGNLYAGGTFTTAGGSSANYIAKWNGSSWSALGSGMNGNVGALACDGSGNLYSGGTFTTAGGSSANYIAKWNGSSWSALGSGMNGYVRTLVFSSGNLYAGGRFTTAGSVAANRIAKWNGSSWSALSSGLNNEVLALACDSSGNLYVSGSFTTAGGINANRIVKWGN